jgi:hypothetical protein
LVPENLLDLELLKLHLLHLLDLELLKLHLLHLSHQLLL